MPCPAFFTENRNRDLPVKGVIIAAHKQPAHFLRSRFSFPCNALALCHSSLSYTLPILIPCRTLQLQLLSVSRPLGLLLIQPFLWDSFTPFAFQIVVSQFCITLISCGSHQIHLQQTLLRCGMNIHIQLPANNVIELRQLDSKSSQLLIIIKHDHCGLTRLKMPCCFNWISWYHSLIINNV